MREIINLIRWPIDLALNSWISPCSSTFIFEYWPRSIFITLQTFIKLSIDNVRLTSNIAPEADTTALLSGIDSVPDPHFCAWFREAEFEDAVSKFGDWVEVF